MQVILVVVRGRACGLPDCHRDPCFGLSALLLGQVLLVVVRGRACCLPYSELYPCFGLPACLCLSACSGRSCGGPRLSLLPTTLTAAVIPALPYLHPY